MRVSGSDLRLLRVFDTVVRQGGFAAAEQELNICQSTISNHMTALEQRLGFVLCHRGRGGFSVTEKGRAVFEAARHLDKALQDFAADVASVRGELRGELRLAVLDAVADDPGNRLSEAIARFGETAPEVKLVVVQERPQDIQQKVADGIYHCAIGSFLGRIEGIDYEKLYEERHGLYCARGHEAFGAADADLDAARLASMPFVHRGYWRDEDAFRQVRWRVEATVFQMEPQLMLIRSGRYLGFLPHHYARRWVEAGELRAIRPDDIGYVCVFELFSPKVRRRSDIAMAFMDAVRAAWSDTIPSASLESGSVKDVA